MENKDNDDLVEIELLNDATLLHNLRVRTENNDIYSYCGPTLIAMNPFQMVHKLFTPEVRQKFKDFAKDTEAPRIQPHVWYTAS